MNECDEMEEDALFYEAVPTNNVEDLIECKNLYFAIIIVIIDSAMNHQWMLKSLVKRLSGSRIFLVFDTQSQRITF